MAALAPSVVSTANGSVVITRQVLTSSDTLQFTGGQTLILENTTGGSLTVTITGSTATGVTPDGYGSTISTAGGYAITVAASTAKAVRLDTIRAWLSGTITLTGASGLTAILLG